MIMRIPLLRTVCKAIVAKADWDESKHPRADNGQFGSGSGGSSKPKKPSKTRRKMERREEAASQARVGGAIQSLLSGGSALDKIGWFKQPEKKPKAEERSQVAGLPKSKLAREMIERGIKVPPPPTKVDPGSKAIDLKTQGGIAVPIKVTGYKQDHDITVDPPITVNGVKIGGRGTITTAKINGKSREVLHVRTAKGPAMLTVDINQLKAETNNLPEKQYTATKVKETINSDGYPIEIDRWRINGGSRTTSSGNYIDDAHMGDFLDQLGIADISVKDAISLYEQLMETPEKLQRQKERNAASSARMQHFQDMEEMENMRGG